MKTPRFIANALGFLGQTLTSAGNGVKKFSGAFTPTAGAKPSNAIQQAGAASTLVPPWNRPGGEASMDTALYPNPGPTAATLEPVGSPIRQPIKLESDISPQRVQQYLLSRFNPIRGLSPRLLSTYLEQFDLGFLRQMALVWNKIRERDDAISSVIASRECKPADMNWEIAQTEESPEAEAHKKALEEFYNGLTCTHALDQNMHGGVALVLKLMMKAIGDKFAPFEIIWRPEGDTLTAELKYVPVWFFENRTGQLRFLPYELALQGVPLAPGGWMVHIGDGLFAATSICYIYKQMGLKTWVTYQEKFGIPFLHAKTNSDYQSTEWNGLLQAIQNFSSDGGIVTKTTTEILPIIMGSQGSMPHEPFVDRMDRAVARIWRGGDLSSMSQGGGASASGGVGALPQMENESALSKTDAELLSETCQFYLDRWVIRYRFGDDVAPKAKFLLQPPQQIDTDREIKVDQFLLSVGVPLAISDLVERYGRNLPDEGDVLAHAPAAPSFGGGGNGSPGDEGGEDPANPAASLGNQAPGMRRYKRTATDLQAVALAKALAPLRAKLAHIATIENVAERNIQLQAVRKSLPDYVTRGASPEVVRVIAESLATATVNGAIAGSTATGHLHHRQRFPINGHETFHQ